MFLFLKGTEFLTEVAVVATFSFYVVEYGTAWRGMVEASVLVK